MKKFALVLNTAYSDAPEDVHSYEIIGIYDTEDEAQCAMADWEEGIKCYDAVIGTFASANSLCLETMKWTYYAKVMSVEGLVRKLFRTLNPVVEPQELDTVVNFALGIAACERDLVDSIMKTLNKKHLVPVF